MNKGKLGFRWLETNPRPNKSHKHRKASWKKCLHHHTSTHNTRRQKTLSLVAGGKNGVSSGGWERS